MILSVSRRTDIPAFFTDWFLNRIAEGYALVPNPYNTKRLSRVPLLADGVDCIVFWTKNAAPLLPRLPELEQRGYFYLFSYTITGLGAAYEPGTPDIETSIETFRALSQRLGPGRVDWRFDPVLPGSAADDAQTVERFRTLCRALAPFTTRCIFSFADPYAHLGRAQPAPASASAMRGLCAKLAAVANDYALPLYTCAEAIDLAEFGVRHAACIDAEKIGKLLGSPILAGKDNAQRANCRCAQSVDIGVYDTCPGGCTYCYATAHPAGAKARFAAHDPAAPMLTGWPAGDEQITLRAMPPLCSGQLSLY